VPTYTYKREDGNYFKVKQSIKEYEENGPLEECPKTGQPCERVINGEGILFKFKGTGFHATDYDKDGQGYDESAMENKADPDIDTYSYK